MAQDILKPGFDLSEFVQNISRDSLVRNTSPTFTNAISAMVANAVSGDTIVLPSGTYHDRNFLKNGVNFRADGPVTIINNGTDLPMLSDETTSGSLGTGEDTVCDFFGPFLFRDTQTPATAGRDHGIIKTSRANSRIRFFDIIGMSSETVNTTGNPCCICASAGTIEVHAPGAYLDSTLYDSVILKASGSATVRLNVDRLRAGQSGSGDGNGIEAGSGNTLHLSCNSVTSAISWAMRINCTAFIDVRNNIQGLLGGIITSTGCVAVVRAYEVKATSTDPLTYALQHGAGTLTLDARRLVYVAAADWVAYVAAAGLTLVNVAVVAKSDATESIGADAPRSVMFRDCFSNKVLSADVTALIASNYTIDTDIA